MHAGVPRTRAPRRLGALLLALFVVAQVHSLTHYAVVAHEICATHGALAHGHHAHHEHDGHDHGTASLLHSAGDEEEGPSVSSSDEHGEHGDHCPLVHVRQQQRWAPDHRTSLEVPWPEVVGEAELVDPSTRRLGGVPLLSLAPKQSPPRVA